MPNRQPSRLNSLFGFRAQKERRPAGVSRRRKKQLGFEALESRQVMSASALVAPPTLHDYSSTATDATSNQTAAGQLDMLARELYWQSLIAAANQNSAGNITRNFSLPNDPLFANQWHLLNSGQQVGKVDFQPIYGVVDEDINVLNAWLRGYTGAGVTVAVIDDGVQLNHPDLAGNINLGLSIDVADPLGNGMPDLNVDYHGTAVAGLIGALANNGIGGTGVAPGASIVPIRFLGAGTVDGETRTIAAFRHAIQEIDITNNSWGPPDIRQFGGPTAGELLAIRDSIMFGRGGLGVVHVFAAGNGAGAGGVPGFPGQGFLDSATYDGFVSSRYVIGVTAVDHDGFYNNFDGTWSGFAETSAAVLVAAPSGTSSVDVATDAGVGSGLWTTDLTGEFGYNIAPDPITGNEFDRDFLADTNYNSVFGGTSGAAPIVSGVVALMMEANPDLSWRDIQEILVRSARTNALTDVPSTGNLTGHEFNRTQSLWIVNQSPVFHDPDPYQGSVPVSAAYRLFSPTLDPNITTVGDDPTDADYRTMHYQATPTSMTNGAGYTVSQGRGAKGELIGYGHGVIDAEMAVLLAEQWHAKGQNLAPERSFTTGVLTDGLDMPRNALINGGHIPAAQVGSIAIGNILVPGGLGGFEGFMGFFEEYAAANPFSAPNGPENTRGVPIFFTVPDEQTMSIESVEVKISLSGGTADAMDNLRILLVSPDGTHSELNHYWIDNAHAEGNLQNFSPANDFIEGALTSVDNGGDLIWTFTSKRNWGERSNNAVIYDAATGEPINNTTGFAPLSGTYPVGFLSEETLGAAIKQGWQLHFENYGTTPFDVNGIEVVWHGAPIEAESQRVQGFIGVDDIRDGEFNYSRVIQSQIDLPNDSVDTLRYGEIVAEIDPNQESFAKNITVTATRVSDGAVKQFVTGHDGNFYFDLVPDEYIISIEDPEGRLKMEDSLTSSGVLDKFKTEWHITLDHFKAWDNVDGSPGDVVVDANGVPVAWLDGNGDELVTGMKGINFLLDPGEPPAPEATINGTVFADINGDGIFNGSDVALPGTSVFGDLNNNGVFDVDLGEVTTVTGANGQYSLVVAGITQATLVNVRVVAPSQWTLSNPANGIQTRFVQPGDVVDNADFYITPPANNPGGGDPNAPGILSGVVFEDLNGNGSRGGNEGGASGITVYIDADNDGVFDAGETSATTSQLGSYVFVNVPPGTHTIRIDVPAGFNQTFPGNGTGRTVNLGGGGSFSNLNFGVQGQEQLDYGDLPSSYDMRPIAGGPAILDPARHTKGAYWMGASIDGEIGASHSTEADGDDLLGSDDEDGFVFGAVQEGATWSFVVTANTFTTFLQGWADWNNDGDFLDVGERIVTDRLLSAGSNDVTVDVPLNVVGAKVNVRFRAGEHSHDPVSGLPRNTDTPFGRALTGEVEDYRLDVVASAVSEVAGMPADFDQDNDVDGSDFLTWQRNVGKTSGATQSHGSVNGDGDVDGDDLAIWQQQFGESLGSGAAASSGSGAASSTTAGTRSGSGLSNHSLAANALSQFKLGGDSTAFVASLSSASPTSGATSELATAQFEASSRSGVANLVDRLRDVGERAKSRFDSIGESVEQAASELADRAEGFEFDSLRRDRAFEDLFGSRRRQGLRAELELELAEADGAEEAFAAIADHFEWRRD